MIYKATKKDVQTIAELAIQMWEDNTLEELAEGFEELTNETSLAFHLKVGFAEANRIICFTKKL